MKRVWIPLLVVALAVGGFFVYRRYQAVQAAAQSGYQTAEIVRGDLTATVGGTGTVHSNQSVTLSFGTSGTVEQVDAALDELVEPGQVLASLRQDSLSQNIILAQAELVEAERAMEALQDSGSARANAQLALVMAQDALEDAQRTRDNLNRARASQETIDSANAGYILAQNAVDTAQGIYNNLSERPENDPGRANALANLANAKKARDKALANVNWYKGTAGEKEIAEADANLEVAQANLADAQREWDRLKEGPDPDDLAAALSRIEAIRATLNLKELVAPFRASVTEVNIKPGDQVGGLGGSAAASASDLSSATPSYAFRLDDLSRLLVDVPISEVDINRIQVNQDVAMTFDAILGIEYQGKIVQVARVGSVSQGVVNFTVTIELVNPDDAVRPGMTAAVNIVSTQLNNVLLVPNRAVRLREGNRVVYVLRPSTNGDLPVPEAITIQLGASSETDSEVVDGNLQPGDLVILNPAADIDGGGPPFMRGG